MTVNVEFLSIVILVSRQEFNQFTSSVATKTSEGDLVGQVISFLRNLRLYVQQQPTVFRSMLSLILALKLNPFPSLSR